MDFPNETHKHPTDQRRFKIERLEQRIAPTTGGTGGIPACALLEFVQDTIAGQNVQRAITVVCD